MKQRPVRSIGKNARGGSMTGLPKKRARLTGDVIDVDDLFGPTMPTKASRAQAAIAIAAAKEGKKGRVILRGGGFAPGLYGITKINKKPAKKETPAEGKAVSGRFIDVEILQEFDKKIYEGRRIPWVEETVEEVQKKFTEEYIASHYLAPAIRKSGQRKS